MGRAHIVRKRVYLFRFLETSVIVLPTEKLEYEDWSIGERMVGGGEGGGVG